MGKIKHWLRRLSGFLHGRGRRASLQATLRVRNTLRFGRPLCVVTGSVRFPFSARGALEEGLWARSKDERAQLELLLRTLRQDDILVDVRAGAGLCAVAAACKDRSVRVYALEPSKALQESVALNDLSNVQTLPDAGRGSLDALLQTGEVERVDVLRIEAAGEVMPLLRGAGTLLAGEAAPTVFFESLARRTFPAGYHPVEALWFLQDCGYSILEIDPDGGRPRPRPVGQDFDGRFVAVKPQHPAYEFLCGGPSTS